MSVAGLENGGGAFRINEDVSTGRWRLVVDPLSSPHNRRLRSRFHFERMGRRRRLAMRDVKERAASERGPEEELCASAKFHA